MSEHTWPGRCLCGALQFDVTGEPADACFCHCASCRAAAGAPFVVWCTFPIDTMRINSGQLTTYKSSQKVERGFCAQCGTTVTYFHEDRPGEIDVATTTLQASDSIVPTRHIWVSDKTAWLEINDGLPQFDRWGQDG